MREVSSSRPVAAFYIEDTTFLETALSEKIIPSDADPSITSFRLRAAALTLRPQGRKPLSSADLSDSLRALNKCS
jgi:hypothetical protein